MKAARRPMDQMVTRLHPDLKALLKRKAKAAGRSLNAEAVYRLDVEGRLRADLAAGRVPEVGVPVDEPVIAPASAPAPVAAISAAAQPAAPASYAPPEMVDEAFQIVHDLYQACIQDHADVVVPSRLGNRAKAFTIRYPRAEA